MRYEILRFLVAKSTVAGGEAGVVWLPEGYTLWEVRNFNDTRLEVIAVSSTAVDDGGN